MAFGESIRSRVLAIVRAVALVATCLTLANCSAPEYSSPAWSGRVVDHDTGAPIEGAIVVVRWPLETFRSDLAGWLVMDEAVTDRDGVFQFKAWGPIRTPDTRGSRTRLSPNVPEIDVFKSEYEVATSAAGTNSGYLDDRSYTGPSVRKVYADGKVIALARFRGTDTQYAAHLDTFLRLPGPLCDYQLIPKIFAAIVMEDRRLKFRTGNGLPHGSLQHMQRMYAENKCTTTFLDSIKGYLR